MKMRYEKNHNENLKPKIKIEIKEDKMLHRPAELAEVNSPVY